MFQQDPMLSSPAGKSAKGQADSPAALRFSTQELAPEHRFAAWRNIIDPMLDVSLPSRGSERNDYHAEMTAFNLGPLIVSSEKFDPLNYELRPAELRRGKVDHWLLGLYKAGQAVSRTGDIIVRSQPGTLSLRPLTKPFTGRLSAVDMVFVYIPRDLYPDVSTSLDALGNGPLSGGLHSLLFDFLLLLEKQLPHLDANEFPRVAQAAQTMIGSCLAPTRDAMVAADGETSATLRERARRHIRRNIQSATLSPGELCRVLGISRTSLYRLFEPHGGVAREIRSQRLIAAHAALADLHDRRRIYEIAEGFGFASADEFSRAFRRQFGYTPREARHLNTDAAPLSPLPNGEGEFTQWIRELGR